MASVIVGAVFNRTDTCRRPPHTMPDNQSDAAQNVAPIRFEDFGLSADILRALADQGYVHPTPIQAEAIPIVLQGRDVMGAAQTGTGKTAGVARPGGRRRRARAGAGAAPARRPGGARGRAPARGRAD